MKSWDVFDTLIARRILDGHAVPGLAREAGISELDFERTICFPIAENLGQVRPGDLLVSDMHLPDEEIAALVREVTGLQNRVIVTPDGKRSGRIWQQLSREHSIELHTGDDRIADDDMARHEGIPTLLFEGALMTETERRLQAAGFHRLGMACREARLRTFDPEYRDLELAQTQINFPMLYLAALALRPHLAGRRVLASARDCWLWQELLRDVAHADALYWHSSRLARAFPLASFIDYTVRLAGENAVLLDLCGSGWSLKRLKSKIETCPSIGRDRKSKIDLWMLSYCGRTMADHYERLRKTRGEVHWLIASASQGLEHNNLAPHPMISDVTEAGPIFANPTGFDWEGSPEIRAQHQAFRTAALALKAYREDAVEPAPPLELIAEFIAQLPELAFFPREDRFVQDELRRRADV